MSQVIDSSAWLEYFADGPNAAFFADAIEATDDVIVPSLVVYEVYRRLASQRTESIALTAVAAMTQSRVVDLDTTLAIEAARLGAAHSLPLADSVILATARTRGADLWTQDADFEGLPGIHFRRAIPARPDPDR